MAGILPLAVLSTIILLSVMSGQVFGIETENGTSKQNITKVNANHPTLIEVPSADPERRDYDFDPSESFQGSYDENYGAVSNEIQNPTDQKVDGRDQYEPSLDYVKASDHRLIQNYSPDPDYTEDQIDVDPPNANLTPDEEYDVLDELVEQNLMLVDDDGELYAGANTQSVYSAQQSNRYLTSEPVDTILNDEARQSNDGYLVERYNRETKPTDYFINGVDLYIEGNKQNEETAALKQDTVVNRNVRMIDRERDNKRFERNDIRPETEPIQTLNEEDGQSPAGGSFDGMNTYEKAEQENRNKEEETHHLPSRVIYNARRQRYNTPLKLYPSTDFPGHFAFSSRSQQNFNPDAKNIQNFNPSIKDTQELPVKQEPEVFLRSSVMQWRRLPERHAISKHINKHLGRDSVREETGQAIRKVLEMAEDISAVNIIKTEASPDRPQTKDDYMKPTEEDHRGESTARKESLIFDREGSTREFEDLDKASSNEAGNQTMAESLLQLQPELESTQNGTESRLTPPVLRGHHISLLRLVLERLSVRQFTWWDLLIASSITIGVMVFLVGLAVSIQLCVRHCEPRACCCSWRRTEYSPSIKQASSNGTIYDVDYTLDSLRMIRGRRGMAGKSPCLCCWWGFTSCCKKPNSGTDSIPGSHHSSSSSSPSLHSATDVSVVSTEMGTQYEHSDAMISSFVTNDLVVELNDRDSTCTSTSEGFEYYAPQLSSSGGHRSHSLGRNAHTDYNIGVTEF